MKQSFIRKCSAVALALLTTVAAADTLPERGATDRVGNWYFKSISERELNEQIDALDARIVDLEVVGTQPMRFSAALVKNGGAQTGRWWWRFGMTKAQVDSFARENRARLIDVEVYRDGGQRRYAVVMKRDTQTPWRFLDNQTPESLKAVYDDLNMRLIDVERYRHNGQTRFAAIMVDNTGANHRRWAWFVNRTPAQVSAKLDELNLRVLDLDRHGSASTGRFDVVMAAFDSGRQGYWYYYGISSNDLVTMTRRHGARVIDVERAGNSRFDVVMLNNGISRRGHCGGQMAHATRKVEAMMKRHAIPGAQVAVARGDRLVMSCALGTADLARNEKVTPASLFRIMSVSKPITAAAVRALADRGRYALNDRMIDAMGSRAPSGPFADPNMRDITVQNLLDHRAGFYRDLPYDPMVSQTSVAADMGEEPPLRCGAIARHAISAFPLGFDPGVVPSSVDTDAERRAFSRRAYSNLGYCILQQIVAENANGTYQQIVKREILEPAGITAMRVGRGRARDRVEDEVRYYDVPFARKISSQYAGVQADVPRPYSYVVEAMAGHGGRLASANDLVRFARFTPTEPYTFTGWQHSGSLSGTRSIVINTGGATVAIIVNATPTDDDSFDLGALSRDIVNDTAQWPTRNLWSEYGYPE